MLSRRGFLIGLGSVLTTAFVADAREFVHTTGKPLAGLETDLADVCLRHGQRARLARTTARRQVSAFAVRTPPTEAVD